MKNIECEGQMSIFNFFSFGKEGNNLPALLIALEEELKVLFPTLKDSEYETWSHVPNLGKRYSARSGYISSESLPLEKMNEIIDRYKKKDLEVSFLSSPNFSGDKNEVNLHISTMWLTKGHKEKAVA